MSGHSSFCSHGPAGPLASLPRLSRTTLMVLTLNIFMLLPSPSPLLPSAGPDDPQPGQPLPRPFLMLSFLPGDAPSYAICLQRAFQCCFSIL